MIDLHRLRFLRELAARGTVTAVAEALAYTPSAVSQQLSTLEKEIGVPLLERRGRRVVLTASGRALVAGADEVFRAAESAVSSSLAAAAAVAGPVHVGSFPSVGATVIPAAFAALRRDHPALEIHYRQHEDSGLAQLKLGHLDVWIDQYYTVLPEPAGDGLVHRELLAEPVCLAVPSGGDLGPDLTSYRDHLWAGDAPMSACDRLLRRVCDEAGFEPEVRFVTEDVEVILQLVASGVAVAVLPRLALRRPPDGVTIHRLPGIERKVVAMTRPGSNERPSVAVVVDELARAGEALGSPAHLEAVTATAS